MANPFKVAANRLKTDGAPPRTRNAFGATNFNRLTSDWVMASSRSADGELRYELRTMRTRARELVRNSPFGARYHQLIAENVVGPKGYQLCAQNMLKDGSDLHEGANKSIEDAWAEWSRPENCDVQGRLSLTELLSLAASAWGTDGEMPIRFLRGPQFGPFGFKLQVLDPDYFVETPNTTLPQAGGTTVSNGVELDEYGGPVAYHLWTRHPYDMQGRFLGLGNQDRTVISASDMILAFIPLRAGQTRGIPHGSAIMTTLKMLDGYIEAELVAARIASASMGAIEDLPNGDGPAPNANAGIGGVNNGDSNDGYASPGGGDIPAEAEPGALLDLRGKGKLTLWDPQHPTSAFPDFTRMMSHFAAIGWGISYGTLTGDLSQANYGSLRIGMLDERDHWERMQQFMVVHVLDRIYREWLKMALLNGMIPGIVDRDVRRWTRVMWQPRGFPWIDPLKDAQGDLLEVAAGTYSLTRMAAKRGHNLEQIIQERAREIKLFERYDVPSTITTTITDRPTEEANPGGTDTNADANAGTSDTSGNDPSGKSWGGALPTVTRTIRPRLTGT